MSTSRTYIANVRHLIITIVSCAASLLVAFSGYVKPFFILPPGLSISALCVVAFFCESERARRVRVAGFSLGLICCMIVGDHWALWWLGIVPGGLIATYSWRSGRISSAVVSALILFLVLLVPFSNWLYAYFFASFFSGTMVR